MGKILIRSVFSSIAGFVFSILLLLAELGLDRIYSADMNRATAGILVVPLFAAGIPFLVTDSISRHIARRKFSGKDALIGSICSSLLYIILMIFAFGAVADTAPVVDLMPDREMAGGYMVLLMQLFAAIAAGINMIIASAVHLFGGPGRTS